MSLGGIRSLLAAHKTLNENIRRNGQNGYWAPTCRWQPAASGSDGWTSQLVSAARFEALDDKPITRLGFIVNTASSSGTDPCTLDIVDKTGATILCSTGQLTGLLNSQGPKVLQVIAPFRPTIGEIYYARFWATVTGSPTFHRASIGSGFVPEAFGETVASNIATGSIGTWDGAQKTAQSSMPANMSGFTRGGTPMAIIVRSD